MRIKILQTPNEIDLQQIASIHKFVLLESIFSQFDLDFLKLIYMHLIENHHNLTLIMIDQGQIIGYLLATTNNQKMLERFIRKNFKQVIINAFKLFVTQPLLIIHILQYLLEKPQSKYLAELQFIAIKPKSQSQGLGTKLLYKLDKIFKSRGIHHYQVGTKASNKLSNQFYLKRGFKFLNQVNLLGDNFNYYVSRKL